MESTQHKSGGMKICKASNHVLSCRACRVWKSIRQPHQSQADIGSVKSATHPTERLYTDIFGPIKTASLKLSKFFITLLEE